MNSYTAASLEKALKHQVRRLNARVETLKQQSDRLSTYRLITFLAGSGLSYAAATTYTPWLFALVVFLFLSAFSMLVYLHRQTDHYARVFSIWSETRNKHLSRMQLDWRGLPSETNESGQGEHPFASDLNLVGNHSLHRLMDTAIYEGGSAKLKEWLLETHPDINAIRERHRLVKTLKPMAHFRDRLELQALLTKEHRSEADWTMDKLLSWMRTPRDINFAPALWILGSLSAVNIVLVLLFLVGLLKPYVIFTFVLYLVIYNYHTGKVKGLFESAYQTEKLMRRFSSVLLYLEQYPYKKESPLRSFCAPYRNADTRPSVYLKRIIRLATAASAQKSQIGWLLINALVPWDLYFSRKMERLKTDLEPQLSRWLDRFYELEALCSLANFAWLNPGYTFSVPDEPLQVKVPFKAASLGHPLIPKHQKVTNDITIEAVGDLLLITGSNMAGKSTFLRTVGINLALCFAGGPVNAESFGTIPFRLFTSINVKDSLDQGLSHFYAEVKRLRKLLDKLESNHSWPLFFFVDEIYKGTNNRERLAGSTAFLKQTAGKHGIGLVSTHDLELARLEEEIPQLSNWHFEETIEDDKMSFEYKLKSGPCPTTNALKIMKMEGLPIE